MRPTAEAVTDLSSASPRSLRSTERPGVRSAAASTAVLPIRFRSFSVTTVDGAAVGDGEPGPVTQLIQARYRALIRTALAEQKG